MYRMTDPTRDPARDLERGPAGNPRANSSEPRRRGSVPAPTVGRPDVGGRSVRQSRAVGWRSRDVVRAAALVFGMYLLVRLAWLANALFLTIFLGVLFAIAISAGVDRLQRYRIPRGIGAAMIVVTFFLLLTAFGAWMAPTLRAQGAELRVKLPEAVDRVEEWINQRRSGMLGVFLGGPAQAPSASDTATAAAPARTQGDTTTANETLRTRIQRQVGGASHYLFGFLSHTVEAVAGLLLVIFLSIYLAADPELYRRGALALLPVRRREQASLVMDRIATVLRKWLVTQLIAMAVMGTVTTVALLVLRVKAAFALGLLAGLFEFIPTLGPILSATPAVAMGFLDSPEKAVLIAAVYMGLQFLENHILIPLLMKGGMDLPPALTVISQALLAIVFGFLGLMVAVPLLATVMVIVQALYVEHLPQHGLSSSRAFSPDLDEPLEDARAGA